MVSEIIKTDLSFDIEIIGDNYFNKIKSNWNFLNSENKYTKLF
jgi:hypothetical protein